ncbi:protein of unknown function [Bradyrhizobium vignae]|uniref:Uncharacterized protein n=1 Tax=Bradyrhizobium vignae TaxID=1549949 RepID=A0A2U3Q4Z4_9BRAD|nr:protein of unknown function [Bradyrhizobium vignae]
METFGDRPPCATWIGVPSLAREEFLIEVEPSIIFVARADCGAARTLRQAKRSLRWQDIVIGLWSTGRIERARRPVVVKRVALA